jgi:hypothetical protein
MHRVDLTTRRRSSEPYPSPRDDCASRGPGADGGGHDPRRHCMHPVGLARGSHRWAIRWANRAVSGRIGPICTLPRHHCIANLQAFSGSMPPRHHPGVPTISRFFGGLDRDVLRRSRLPALPCTALRRRGEGAHSDHSPYPRDAGDSRQPCGPVLEPGPPESPGQSVSCRRRSHGEGTEPARVVSSDTREVAPVRSAGPGRAAEESPGARADAVPATMI